MSTTPLHPPGATDSSALDVALERLVARGVIDHSQALAVHDEIEPLVAPPAAPVLPPAAPETSLRRRLSEVAGYVGAAFVVGAAALFLNEQWEAISENGRVAVLAGIAAVLAIAGAAVVATAPGGLRAVRAGQEEVRRRLASTLLTASAVAVFATVTLLLEPRVDRGEYGALAASLAAAVVVGLGYALVPSALGQLGLAAALTQASALAVTTMSDDSPEPVAIGAALLLLGLVWAGALVAGVLRERVLGAFLAAGLALVGAQVPYFEDTTRVVSYVATVAVTAACFVAYTRTQLWPLLAVGVLGATLVVPEAVSDLTEGALGAAGVMLVAGLSLLAASVAGLRLRQEVTKD